MSSDTTIDASKQNYIEFISPQYSPYKMIMISTVIEDSYSTGGQLLPIW